MLKRLALGLLKGLVIGGGVGAGVQYGLGWSDASGLLGFLIAMGVGGTAGVFAGRPPWLEGAWIEALLKGMVGVGLGALAYWGLTYIPFEIPWPQLEGTHAIAALPALFAPAIGAVYGSLVELDNTGEAAEAAKAKGASARVELGEDEDEDEVPAAKASKRAKKKGA